MNYLDSEYKIDLDYLKKLSKPKMKKGGDMFKKLSPFISMGADAIMPGSSKIIDPIMGLINADTAQGERLKAVEDSRNQLMLQTNPYQMKKGGYLKDEDTYVTKDGRETRRGLWANVYLKKKQGKRDGGMIDNSMVDGGKMVAIADDAQQVKANNPQATDSVETPQAFLDNNEMVIEMPEGGKFVFSDFLKDSDTGESFAAIAKDLVNKRERGSLSQEEYDMYITQLANDNEKAKNMNKKKMMKGGKMMYQQGGDMMGGGDPMMGGDPMAQGGDPMMGGGGGDPMAQGANPEVMPEMGVEGDMGMGQMTKEGFPVDMGNGQQYVFSPDLKEPTTGQPFAAIAQQLTQMMEQGQIQEQEYMQSIQTLAQKQEEMKGGMQEQPPQGMRMGGFMKKKMGGGGYMTYDQFRKMTKR